MKSFIASVLAIITLIYLSDLCEAVAFIDVSKYLQIKESARGKPVFLDVQSNQEQIERNLIQDLSNPTMAHLLKYAFNQLPDIPSDIVELSGLARHKNPTTTVRPYHGQIPRPTMLYPITNT